MRAIGDFSNDIVRNTNQEWRVRDYRFYIARNEVLKVEQR
jgi:hypothetical protein